MASILVVDDDPTARDFIVTVLGCGGHQVREAGDGAEALTEAQHKSPDVIIADLLMPTMDGFEFVRRLREQTALEHTPVIFYTATHMESDVRNLARASGVSDIISKSAEPQQILEAVNKTLGAPLALGVPRQLEEFRRKHLGLPLAKLSQRAETVGPRLDAMIELGLQLASERDPQQLLEEFCVASRKIIGAKFAMVGVLEKEEPRLRYHFASGMNPDLAARLTSPQSGRSVLSDVLSEREPRRLRDLPGNPQVVGLPGEHPPVHSFLCAPIVSPDRVYGWLCLANKIASAEFTDEDEGLAQILAAQVGRVYENDSLYAEVKRSVEELQAEIAERRRVEVEIQKLNAELEQRVTQRTEELQLANQELEAFSYSVSHDLRAPLRAITAFSELLHREYSNHIPADGQRLLEHVRSSGKRMEHLMEDLLRLSRLGRQTLSKRNVGIAVLVHDSIKQLRELDPGRPIEIHVGDLPDCIGDASLLREVFINLLSNAFKFTTRTERAHIEVGCRKQDGETVYFVRDNGAGFDMQYSQKLFGVFQRLHTVEEFEGSGVGLSIVKRIVQRHGGRVWAEGAVNQGAIFYFTLSGGEPVRKAPTVRSPLAS